MKLFEKFGEFDSYKELNEAAKGFLEEKDIDSLYKLAEENGIDKEDVEDYEDGYTDALTTRLTAAVGRVKVMREAAKASSNKGEAFATNTILDFIASELLDDEQLQEAVMRKGKNAKGIYEQLRSGAKGSGCSCGTDRQLVEIIRAYYLGSKEEVERMANTAGGNVE